MRLVGTEEERLIAALIERHAPKKWMTGVGPIWNCSGCLNAYPCSERVFLARFLGVEVSDLEARETGAPLYMTREQAVYRAWAKAQQTRAKTATCEYTDFATGMVRSVTWTPEHALAP